MGARLRSLYLSRAGAVAGAVAGAFSRPCHDRERAVLARHWPHDACVAFYLLRRAPSRARRLRPVLAMRRARALGSSLGGGEESDRGVIVADQHSVTWRLKREPDII